MSITYLITEIKEIYRQILNRPLPLPTPEQTERAIVQMKVARSHIDDFWEGNLSAHSKIPLLHQPVYQLRALESASKSLKAARRLDPNAVLETEEDGKKYHYTQDIIATELLLIESQVYEMAGRNEFAVDYDIGIHRLKRKDQKKNFAKALHAIERAALYQPDSESVLSQRATCLYLVERKRDARKVIQRALTLYPSSIDLIKKSQELR